jgi:cell division protein FtsI/penicillin-binding protein 2
MGQWQYDGGFATYSKQVEGYVRWFVKWDPSILYTSLKAGYQLKIKKTPATVKGLVDRNNKPIDAAAHPSLAGIISVVMQKATATGATDGQDIIMVDAKGDQLAKVTTLTPPINNGTVATTLDMDVQSAAEAAVKFRINSSMVAIQPSTGHVLAVANNTGSQYYDDALLTRVAPGSTFKIITSTALLSKGLTTLSSNVPCPAAITIDNQTLKNSEGEAGDYDYKQDFAASCNNAFSSFWDAGGMSADLLADTGKTYYGLNQKWDLGLGDSAAYMNIPSGLHRGVLAESLVGQGDVVACPLAMCSVAATVASGSFKQPILIPKAKQLTATPLGAKLQGDLKALMASVIAPGGTAAGIFPNDGHFFGKTGTAEYGPTGNPKNNSWFVVFNDQHDIALCALAIDGSYGATTAAPECHTVFKKLGYA